MPPAAAFFFTVLALQLAFTGAVVLLVGRRFPARLPLYAWVAPAAMPLLLFALVAYAFLSQYLAFLAVSHDPFRVAMLTPLARFALAYATLWLIGLLWARMLVRRVFRRR